MRLSKHAALLSAGGVCPILLWDDAECILVDTGNPGQFEQLEQAIAAEGFTVSDLTTVIITHQDIDHVGGIKEVLAASGAEVLAHPLEIPYLDGQKTPLKLAALQAAPDLSPELSQRRADLERGFASRRFPVDRFVENADVLDFCGGIEIFHTPGHTPGHICLFLREGNILITGDALNAADGVLTGPNPVYTPDMAQAYKSLRPLCELPIEKIACYHGGLVKQDALAQLKVLVAADPYQ